MKDPYRILGLLEEKNNNILSDELIRARYLDYVKAYPPDRAPEDFKRIRRAFEQIETEKKRLHYELFDLTLPDKEELMTVLLKTSEKTLQRPTLQQVQRLLADQ